VVNTTWKGKFHLAAFATKFNKPAVVKIEDILSIVLYMHHLNPKNFIFCMLYILLCFCNKLLIGINAASFWGKCLNINICSPKPPKKCIRKNRPFIEFLLENASVVFCNLLLKKWAEVVQPPFTFNLEKCITQNFPLL